MAVTVAASGTQSATVTTEHTLSTQTGAGVFVLVVDASAMVAGDRLELRIYSTALAAGAEQLAYGPPDAVFSGVLEVPMLYSIPVPADSTAGNCRFTLKQTNGTSRNFPWKVLSM